MKQSDRVKILQIICLFFLSMPVWAAGIGGIADNLLNPVGVLSGFIGSGSLLIGGAFLFASIIKYVEHRRSPLMVPMSNVVFLFIAGLILVLLPLAYMLTENGLPFSLKQITSWRL